MVDLPNNQSVQNNSPLDNGKADSGEEKVFPVPAGPEGVRAPERNIEEKASNTEVPLTNAETLRTPEAPSLNEQISTISPQPEERITTLNEEAESNPQIVDKTDKPTETHHLPKTGDKLTKEADEEEEHFIEEVEKHHGRL